MGKCLKKIVFLFFLFFINITLTNAEEQTIEYSTHVNGTEWQQAVTDGKTSGTEGEGKRIEEYKINLTNEILAGKVLYRSYVNENGWLDYVENGNASGLENHRIEMIQIKLTDELANLYDIYYRVHVSCVGWMDWAKNDEITGTDGYNYQIEAIQIKLIKKGEPTPKNTTNIYKEKSFGITYSSNVKDIGWQKEVTDGKTSGTEGKGKNLNQFKIDYTSKLLAGKVLYRSYVNENGWLDYVENGNVSGLENHRIEMIQIKLTDELANLYDIYYRVHVSCVGWMDWAKNDEITGTDGYNYQIEAIQIKLIKKGEATPKNTTNIYKEKNFGITYSSNVKDIGWQKEVTDGKTSGTEGKGKTLNQFKIDYTSKLLAGKVLYRSYVNENGWLDYVENGNASGLENHRIEMIQIKLTDELANLYDIYYRVHVSCIGWMDWAKNDEITGTDGYNYQIEAIQIKLIKKGEPTPKNTTNIYKEKNFGITYSSNVKDIGWQKEVTDGKTSGTEGKGKTLNQFKIDYTSKLLAGKVLYRSYVEDTGWLDYVENGNISGIEGKYIERIQMKLVGDLENSYDIYYRVHVSNIGWLDWAKNDEITGTSEYYYQIEAIQIKLIKKGNITPTNTTNIFKENKLYLNYSTYTEDKQWQPTVREHQTSGNPENNKGISALKIILYNKLGIDGNIQYSTHIGGIGWTSYVTSNNVSGFTDESKRMEAIRIKLSGNISKMYDIYYKTYVEDYGWLDWAKNGQVAGTVNIARKIEGIKIVIVEKGKPAPGSTNYSYLDTMFRVINGKKYYYYNGSPVTGFYTLSGVKYFSNSQGELFAQNVQKIIDVSSHQRSINWNSVKKDGVDGAILRIGYGTSYETDACVFDTTFEQNYYATRDLNILSGIYLYSYAINAVSARIEANFVLEKLNYYHVDKSIPIYYDLEENPWTNQLSVNDYDIIVSTFSNILESNGYKVKIYTYKFLAENRFSTLVRNRLNWIAQYADYCTYNGSYDGWQYTSEASIAGISGQVDVSVWLRR